MKTFNFTAKSKQGAIENIILCVTGAIDFEGDKIPTKKEIKRHIQEHMATEWTRGKYVFTPEQVVVTLSA